MAARIALAAPALLCSLLVTAPALAKGPEGDPAAAVDPAPAVDPAFAVDPAPAPVVVEEAVVVPPTEPAPTVTEAPVLETPPTDYYVEPYVEPYEPEPYEGKPEATLELDSGYFGLGIAPGMTLHDRGFHPNTRFELEFGGTLEHNRRDLALSFGVVTHITPYYERKKPSFGADVTATALLGPVYIRTGLGAVGGLPRAHLLNTTTAGIGGVVGIGLSFGRAPMVRVGVDYDLRVNTKLEPVHTFLLALRFACCRED